MECGQLDPAILAALPERSEILSIAQHGKTRWSEGYKVTIQVGDDEEQDYFLKVIKRADWVDMARAEYEAQKALVATIPEHVIEPVAWGLFDKDKSQAFFLTYFRNLRQKVPSIPHFVNIVKKLHQNSTSPTGKFGFHCTTYWGPPPMRNEWTDSWEEFWARQFQSDIDYAQQVYGVDKDLAEVTTEFIEKVVARLLRPLQTGGRVLKPSLCHGDLWDGNVQVDRKTNQVILFDPCAFYGHGEVDLQAIGEPRYGLQMDVVHLYKTEIGASEPVEDFYDRHELYGVRNNVVVAAICPEWKCLLDVVKEKMRKMLARFPDGFDGFKEKEDASPPINSVENLVHPESDDNAFAKSIPPQEPSTAPASIAVH